MPAAIPGPRELTRRLVERASSPSSPPDSAALHSACEHFYMHLARWMGVAGCDALFGRALSIGRRAHPALQALRIRSDASQHVAGVDEAVRAAGPKATSAALHALLTAVLEQLERFIGPDLVATIVERAIADLGHLEGRGVPVAGEPS